MAAPLPSRKLGEERHLTFLPVNKEERRRVPHDQPVPWFPGLPLSHPLSEQVRRASLEAFAALSLDAIAAPPPGPLSLPWSSCTTTAVFLRSLEKVKVAEEAPDVQNDDEGLRCELESIQKLRNSSRATGHPPCQSFTQLGTPDCCIAGRHIPRYVGRFLAYSRGNMSLPSCSQPFQSCHLWKVTMLKDHYLFEALGRGAEGLSIPALSLSLSMCISPPLLFGAASSREYKYWKMAFNLRGF